MISRENVERFFTGTVSGQMNENSAKTHKLIELIINELPN